jgi:parallel beta-helix repeat protein
LIVRGICDEFVAIARDDVTIQGTPGATINAPNSNQAAISVQAATRVLIDGLGVSGGRFGIAVRHAPDVRIRNCQIENSAHVGINVLAAHVRIVNSTIQNSGGDGVHLVQSTALLINNQVLSNGGSGLYLDGKSAIQATDNTISSNGASGISIYSGSYGRLQDNNTINGNGTNAALSRNGVDLNQSSAEIWGGSISNHAAPGVAAALSSVQIAGTAITGNGGGVLGYLASTVTISDATINLNAGAGVGLDTNSTAQIASSTINNNGDHGIRLLFGSKLKMATPATVVGANRGYGLWCGDAESSVFGTNLLNFSPPNAAGGVAPSCTGF